MSDFRWPGFLRPNIPWSVLTYPNRESLKSGKDTTADVIFHLAGVNRPEKVEQFEEGNAGFTQTLIDLLQKFDRKPHVIVSSSVQAELDNPYGQSKRHGEGILQIWAQNTGSKVSVFRLTNLFGKWCRPNYNSVTGRLLFNTLADCLGN